jgi:uncharacterized protein YkwD
MNRRAALTLALSTAAAAACTGPGEVRLGPDGKPLPQVYRISSRDTDRIQLRMLESVNTLRSAAQVPAVALNSQLIAAAATHARDMAVQNRPWHFGSDGSSPITRAERSGYTGRLLGEVLSESFETELETLSAWMTEPDKRERILDPRARDLGFAWYQEQTGKIWWVMNLGAPAGLTTDTGLTG